MKRFAAILLPPSLMPACRTAGARWVAASSAILLAGTLLLPEAGRAFTARLDAQTVSLAALGGIGSFTPASVDPRMAARVKFGSLRDGGGNAMRMFRFTPASATGQSRHSVTVAVRMNGAKQPARAASVRNAIVEVAPGQAAAIKITPTAYNLGVARGYRSFATNISLPSEIRSIEMPDLSKIERSPRGVARRSLGAAAPGAQPGGRADRPSRFNTRIALENTRDTGRDPRTLEGEGNVSVDVAAGYKVTRNLNLTAGVRYSRERDRLAPLTDAAQDNQAVYVGTQFRF